MAWLVNSKEPEIGQIHMFLSTTKELRDAVIETYSDPEHAYFKKMMEKEHALEFLVGLNKELDGEDEFLTRSMF
ncbi:hypothetical protein AAG906_002263 [Vitis piasezkii]|uniref:Uncharacterized protein n=1 Tax=Vitis vinifera TaxID=29760 RepID=A0A438D0R1_VITVI|nr:hypothetical protein CK203_088901 [Vitis vinifera]